MNSIERTSSMHEFESLFYKIRNSAEPKKSNEVKDLTNFLRYNSVQPSLADQGYSVVIISRPFPIESGKVAAKSATAPAAVRQSQTNINPKDHSKNHFWLEKSDLHGFENSLFNRVKKFVERFTANGRYL